LYLEAVFIVDRLLNDANGGAVKVHTYLLEKTLQRGTVESI